jgi:hypothetical protein
LLLTRGNPTALLRLLHRAPEAHSPPKGKTRRASLPTGPETPRASPKLSVPWRLQRHENLGSGPFRCDAFGKGRESRSEGPDPKDRMRSTGAGRRVFCIRLVMRLCERGNVHPKTLHSSCPPAPSFLASYSHLLYILQDTLLTNSPRQAPLVLPRLICSPFLFFIAWKELAYMLNPFPPAL